MFQQLSLQVGGGIRYFLHKLFHLSQLVRMTTWKNKVMVERAPANSPIILLLPGWVEKHECLMLPRVLKMDSKEFFHEPVPSGSQLLPLLFALGLD